MVRVIEYRLQDAAGEVTEIFALITTLLGPDAAPARELADLYHARWEIETALRAGRAGGPLHGVLVTLLATTSQDPHAHRVATARTNAQGFFSFQLAKHKLGNTVAYQVWYRGGPIASWAGDPAYAVFDAGYSADFVLP